MRLLINCKSRIRFTCFTIAEMLFSMVLIATFVAVSAPLISIRDKMQGQDLSSIMCVKNELAANSSENITESACASQPLNPCCNAVKSCRYDENNACPTLSNYADNGVGNETVNGKKTLGTVCDQGGATGCRYFIMGCNQDNTTCSNSTNNYNLQYYLNLPTSSINRGKKPVMDMAENLYNEGSPNIAYSVNNTCTKSPTSIACYIAGITPSAPVLPTSFQMDLTPPLWITTQTTKVDPNTGDIYISGQYNWNHGSATVYDAMLIKMNSSGNMTAPYGFQKLIQSSYATFQTIGAGIGFDSSDNVYWGVETWVNNSLLKAPGIIKMNSLGNMTAPNGWQMQIKEAAYNGAMLYGEGFNVGPDGNIYITTYDLKEVAGTRDATLIRMNSSGNITLQKRINSITGSDEYGYGIAADSDGGIYVAGASANNGKNEGVSDADLMAIKMNSSGNMTAPNGWQVRINSTDHDYDCAVCSAFDNANQRFYLGGASTGASGTYDIAILGLNATDGTVLFQHRMANTVYSSSNDWIRDMSVDSSGNLYATGETATSGTNNDLVVMKLNMSGNLTAPYGWQLHISGTSASNKLDSGQGIDVGSDGFIYVSGNLNNGASNADLIILKMNILQTSSTNIYSDQAPWSNITTNKMIFGTAPNYVITNPFTVYYTPTMTVANPGYTFQ